MKILVAEHSGFCFGVKRAIDMAEDKAKEGSLLTYGPLIHNSQEVDRLSKLGISDVTAEDIDLGQTVLIRTHGVGPEVYQELKEKNCQLVDATCPFVAKAQQYAAQAVADGYQLIILGDETHPEVEGICAWSGHTARVVRSWRELEHTDLDAKIAVLAQTTEKEERFQELVDYLKPRAKELRVMNTICYSTRSRQQATAELSQKVDLMIIIGGRHSSNTRKLWEICQNNNVPSYLVESASEIQTDWFKGKNSIGISAGASTPAWIVEEVKKRMEEIKDAMMAEVQEEKETVANTENEAVEQMSGLEGEFDIRSFQRGDLVKGTVVKITSDEVLLDIGGKSEGIIPANELAYSKVDPRELVNEGDELLVEVIKEDKEGNIILSRRRAIEDEAYEKLAKAQEEGTIINAKVVEVVKGGLVVDVGTRGFVPASQIDRAYVEDLNQYLHQELRLKVIELNREKKKAVLSQREVLEAEYQEQKKALWAELAEGQVRRGVVKRLVDFGAFVDIGGVDGLLHISEMSWTHVKKPSDVVNIGDEVEVYVLKADQENERISLSLKKLLKSPWQIAEEKYQVGSVCEGKVVRIVPFGAFIEIEPGVDGLAHISQLSTKRVNKVEDVLSVGDVVKAKILEIDPERQRIGLSLKELETDKEEAEVQEFLDQQPELEGSITIGEAIKEAAEAAEDKVEDTEVEAAEAEVTEEEATEEAEE